MGIKRGADVLRNPGVKKAQRVDAEPPLLRLLDRIRQQKPSDKKGNVLMWFRKDLRVEDNKALFYAAKKARGNASHVIACYTFAPDELEWHGSSPAKTDFLFQTLRLVREKLRDLRVPLVVLTPQNRHGLGKSVLDFVKKNNVSHIFANFEYEYDEIHRDIEVVKDGAARMQMFHDAVVVEPGALVSGTDKPLQVFTPYHKAWITEVSADPSLMDPVESPSSNDDQATKDFASLFDSEIPQVPEKFRFGSVEEEKRIRELWPAGEDAAKARLDEFLAKKVARYGDERSNPAKNNSSRLSPYFAAGSLSPRTALTKCRAVHKGKSFDLGTTGVGAWVREIVFREFYKHVLGAAKPHNAMNLPDNLKFDFVEWENDPEGWERWCTGTLGVPFVDAGMRQLRTEAWMHNRLRMNTASYLKTNLLLDYRRGERFFAEHLIDFDLASNTQGWEPSYTVFNPVVQAEKNDPNGDYIRKWVPELAGVEGKAVFDPYNRLPKKEFEKLGYPAPYVDFQATKDRCIERYKEGIRRANL